jgi:hypothetical protein
MAVGLAQIPHLSCSMTWNAERSTPFYSSIVGLRFLDDAHFSLCMVLTERRVFKQGELNVALPSAFGVS